MCRVKRDMRRVSQGCPECASCVCACVRGHVVVFVVACVAPDETLENIIFCPWENARKRKARVSPCAVCTRGCCAYTCLALHCLVLSCLVLWSVDVWGCGDVGWRDTSEDVCG